MTLQQHHPAGPLAATLETHHARASTISQVLYKYTRRIWSLPLQLGTPPCARSPETSPTCSFVPKLEAFEINSIGHEAESTREPALNPAVCGCAFFASSGESVMRTSREPHIICSLQPLSKPSRTHDRFSRRKNNFATSQDNVFPRYS